MGIQDRDYYRTGPTAARQLLTWTQSAVGLLITINLVVFVVQILGQDPVTRFLSAQADLVFKGHVWKLVTANFAHSTTNVWHVVGNMMFLWLLGREVEHIYGRRDFLILYFSAGVVAILAEALWNYFLLQHGGAISILGASGAVMAVVALCTLFYPKKLISLMFLPPAPLWLICLLYVGMDLFGVLKGHQPSGTARVANIAHLAGFLVGFLYWFFDLRLGQLRRKWQSPRSRATREPAGKILDFQRESVRASQRRSADPVFARVDQLLEKIHTSGLESLSEQEMEFLRANSGRFRRKDETE